MKGRESLTLFHMVWATSGVSFLFKGTFKDNIDKTGVFPVKMICSNHVI